MEIPTPVDVSRLKNILSGAKNIMNKVESGDFKSGNIDARALTDEGVAQLQSEGVVRTQTPRQVPTQNGMPVYTNIQNSRMPEAIKKAMIENPIPQYNPLAGGSFNIEDVADLVEKPMGHPPTPRTTPRKSINENYAPQSDDLITISRNELSELIKTELISFLSESFTKTLQEQTIKKTINTLIKEGKIAVKKKI